MAYTTIDLPTDYFNTVLYSGNGSTQTISGVGFQPDWTWIKCRSNADNHSLQDSVRGANKHMRSDSTLAETTSGTVHISSWNSDGFALGSGDGQTNASSRTYVSWNWLAGTSFSNDASATSVGTIDSSGSTNQTAGFSIVSWTGTGSAGTVAHNLGSVPEWYIIKNRSDANNWAVYHHKSNSNPEQYALYLDGTSAATDDSGLANDTAPTSTVFSLTNGNYGNQSSYNYIGYFFSEVKGYSKFGSYTGNANTDGPFVYTGFKPAWIMVKATDAAKSWYMWDNKRSTNGSNVVDDQLLADTTDSEFDGSNIDMLSNGFKFRGSGSGENGSGTNYIYMAFAESPFVSSGGIPTTAR
jgi:hypothetical protein